MVKSQPSILVKRQVAGYITGIAGPQGHAADVAVVINDRADSCIVCPDIGYNTDQSAACHDVHIFLDAIVRSLVDPKYLKPVSRVLCNDTGGYFFILHIFLIKLIQLSETV